MLRPLMGGIGPLGMATGGAAAWYDVPGKTCVRAYKPKGAASLAASYINLVLPGTGDAAPGVAPTLDADGWKADGTKYLISSNVAISNTRTLIARIKTPASWTNSVPTVLSYRDAAIRIDLIVRHSGISNKIHFQVNDGITGWYSADSDTLGALTLNGVYYTIAAVVAPNSLKLYINGSLEKSGVGPATITSAAAPLAIGAITAPAPAQFFNGSILAAADYSDALTAGEVAIVSSAMAAL